MSAHSLPMFRHMNRLFTSVPSIFQPLGKFFGCTGVKRCMNRRIDGFVMNATMQNRTYFMKQVDKVFQSIQSGIFGSFPFDFLLLSITYKN